MASKKQSSARVPKAIEPDSPSVDDDHHVLVDVPSAACPKCKSTNRERYTSVRTMAIAGTLKDGTRYTHIVWRRTRCQNCGQRRIDRTHENRASKSA